ncbi:unnamed protein product [Caenorhabditis brenneri]
MMRVLILYTLFNQDKLCHQLFVTCSVITYILSVLVSIPTVFGTLLCVQLDTPFQDGAILISTSYVFRNPLMNTIYVIFNILVILLIVISTGLVVMKLRSEQVKKAASQSFQRSKAETTLTITAVLICVPMFLVLGLLISILAKLPFYSYILSVRPWMLDLRSWNTLNTIIDFLTTRIPSTTLMTSYCVTLGPDTYYRFILFGVYFTFNNAQFFTGLFCSMRVLILYTLVNQNQLCKRLFTIWSFLSYLLSFSDAVSTLFYPALCIQMNSPFQDGSIAIMSAFMFGNNLMNMLHFIFSTGIVILIVLTTGLVIFKLRSEEMRKATSRSLDRTKAETTLTVTTILIIIPLFLAQGLTISSLLKSPYYSYILSVRPLMLDLRVNVVSIYFYLTHPVFKGKRLSGSGMFGSATS